MTDDFTLAQALFGLTILATLAITWWAARRSRSATDFYAAGARITGFQNGLAIAGDFLSAATFLGITGLIFGTGYDAIIYIISPLVGMMLILGFFADQLRNLGRFTLADVLAVRLEETAARGFAALSVLSVSIFYLIAQVIGAGTLIQVLFGIDYSISVVIVGVLMAVYVAFGGMLATTWVQIVKAVLLVLAVSVLAVLVLVNTGFSIDQLYERAADTHPLGMDLFAPGNLLPDPLSTISLTLALTFGAAGLPHLLIRFFTVPDAREARRSVVYASSVIAYVFLLIFFIIGFATIVFVTGDPASMEDGQVLGGGNMVVIHLSRIVGGSAFLGIIAAVAFATILAVVAGLTLASAGALSHDLYARIFRRGKTSEREEVIVLRLSALVVGGVAILLGLMFEGQNIAYMIALALTVAASANFPVLLLAITWRGLTTRGAVIGGGIGLVSSIVMVVLGPTVWVDVMGNPEPIVPWRYPALFTMALSFVAIWAISMSDPKRRSARADMTFRRQRAIATFGPDMPG